MADVFISYAREDRDFARRLHDALARVNRDTWVDWEGIPPTAEWLNEICYGIESSDTFVCTCPYQKLFKFWHCDGAAAVLELPKKPARAKRAVEKNTGAG
jgi:hypothetical protein